MVGQQTPDWSSGSLRSPLAILYDNSRETTARVVNESLTECAIAAVSRSAAGLVINLETKWLTSVGEEQGGDAPDP